MSDDTKIDNWGTYGIFGGSGAGKTFFAHKRIIPQIQGQRRVVIDPSDGRGHKTARSLLQALYDGEQKLILSTASATHAIPVIYGAWLYSTPEDPIYVIADEATQYMDKKLDGLNRVMFQGRHRGLGMLVMAQKVAAIHTANRSQFKSTFWMRMTEHNDIQAAKNVLGPEAASMLPDFKQGEFTRR